MVDVGAVFATNSCAFQRVTNATAEVHERLDVGERKLLAVIRHQEKPVSSPRDVAGHGSIARHADGHGPRESETSHVGDRHAPVFVELGGDDADRRFDPVLSGRNAPDARQRDDEPDHAVPAHSEVANVVEEDDARRATRIDGLAEEGADHDVRAARLGDDRGAVVIVFRTQPLHAFAEATDT